MSGNASDSYWSSNGTTPTGGAMGNIGSNGPITLSGSSSIHGNAWPGAGYSVSGATKVTGSTAPLTTPLVYPDGDVGTAANYYTKQNAQGDDRNVRYGDTIYEDCGTGLSTKACGDGGNATVKFVIPMEAGGECIALRGVVSYIVLVPSTHSSKLARID